MEIAGVSEEMALACEVKLFYRYLSLSFAW